MSIWPCGNQCCLVGGVDGVRKGKIAVALPGLPTTLCRSADRKRSDAARKEEQCCSSPQRDASLRAAIRMHPRRMTAGVERSVALSFEVRYSATDASYVWPARCARLPAFYPFSAPGRTPRLPRNSRCTL
nr:uncharacterized protein LOC126543938 isoform X2 [Dermacentor andersoni]